MTERQTRDRRVAETARGNWQLLVSIRLE